jgi:hypothetical protein
MSGIDFDEFLRRLSRLSEERTNDPSSMQWPASINPDGWYFTPELISLYGTPAWAQLDERQRKRLSVCEALNFFSMNVHGEKYLISEIGRLLYSGGDAELSRYLLHFVAEETRHMMYFSGFCLRYAGRVYADRSLPLDDSGSGDGEIDRLLLFARINVFEELVDHYNRRMAHDPRLEPVVREINRIHHVEELRHLAFGRRFLGECIAEHVSNWNETRRAQLRQHLTAYLQYVWKQYYNPDTYADAGFAEPFELWRSAFSSPAAASHRNKVNGERLRYLRNLDLLEVP